MERPDVKVYKIPDVNAYNLKVLLANKELRKRVVNKIIPVFNEPGPSNVQKPRSKKLKCIPPKRPIVQIELLLPVSVI